MQIVIDIPEELYEALKNPEILSTMYHASRAADAVRSGTPLPEHLNKIKAEIEALSNANPSYTHTCDVVDREDVIDIIDKYIEGSESE